MPSMSIVNTMVDMMTMEAMVTLIWLPLDASNAKLNAIPILIDLSKERSKEENLSPVENTQR